MSTVRNRLFAVLFAFGLMAGLSAFQASAVEAKTDKTDKVNVNTATADELEKLPGIGEATSKKIIAGRPYKTDDDLVKAGVPKATVEKIATMITFGKAPKADKKDDTKVAKTDKTDKTDTEAKVPPKPGMVWVNTDSKVYHKEGSRWYGKTKVGEFMTEEDAIKAGNRADKGESAKDDKKDTTK